MDTASFISEHPTAIYWIISTGLFLFISVIGFFGKKSLDRIDSHDKRIRDIETNYKDEFKQVRKESKDEFKQVKEENNENFKKLFVSIEGVKGKINTQVAVCKQIQDQKK